jgi:BioD-like phosphotransacetylase family protein
VAEEKYDEVLKRILDAHGSLESECDVIVCLGTGFHDIPPGLALDFNIDVANNLGALLAPVATGFGRTPQEVIRSSLVMLNLLEGKRCDVLALFVNRVVPERMDEILGLLAKEKTHVPILAMPELALLAKPTIGRLLSTSAPPAGAETRKVSPARWRILKSGPWSFPTFSTVWSRGLWSSRRETDPTSSWEAFWPTPPAPTPGSQGSF